jgi:hypothetical protein
VPTASGDRLTDFTATVNLKDAVTGDYAVQLVINDAFSHAVVASATGTFQVNRVALQALAGKVAMQNSSVYQGTSNLCTETVTNRSSAALPGGMSASLFLTCLPCGWRSCCRFLLR